MKYKVQQLGYICIWTKLIMFSLYNVFHLRYILSLESHSQKPFAQVKAYLAHRTKI